MAFSSSSSGSLPNAPRKYDVFISFRGEDTRYNFTSHLHAALNRAFLEVFRDDKKLEKGDEITPSLIQAIKDSSVSVIVFSEEYASSKWCLDELHQIMQYRKDEGQYVIPIFYGVDPKDVRNQTGAYKKAFEKHDIDYQYDPDRVNKWRAALSEAGKLSGKHCETSTDESNLIEEIVADVGTKLERLHNCPGTLKDAIGIDEMIKPIEELLEKSHKVGIWGMGGVGKTTMAKALFAKLSYRYDNRCFLENIREKLERDGSEHVCDSLVSELLGQDMHINSSNAAFVARRLRRKKNFVVLDDVKSSKQLEDLQAKIYNKICDFLGEGSKVIITTRDKKLLWGNGYEIHEAKGLSYDNSRRLFIHEAFGSNHPEYGYEHLIRGFVDYTQHNPLALKVLGSLVRCVEEKVWDGLLRKLRAGNPNNEIQKVLRLSYDNGLDYKEQQIFLDIACFLKGESEEFVEELLESYGFYPTFGIQTLIDKALIIKTNGKVEMHDLLHEMGLQIVREESINEPGKRSRLWDPSEIYDVLKNCEGEKEVEGLMFHISKIRPLELTAKTFNKMTRIRFLRIYSSYYGNGMSIPTSLESISTKIRYFHWEGYPGKSLPSNFCAELLLELNLKGSMVETLWEGVKDLANLRRLILQKCHNLRELPDFSKARSLESVDLSHCKRLSDVHASLLSLHSLISLDVRYCYVLRSLKSRIHLKSLRELEILDCKNLKEFSVSSEELTSLNLSNTLVEELSPSIMRCPKLRGLHLVDTKLNHVPIQALSCLTFLEELSISNLQNIDNVRMLLDRLRSLQSLSLIGCCNLTELPDNITQLSNLEVLDLKSCSDLTKLPVSMRHLSKLKYLSVKGCTALWSLPELPPSLRKLKIIDGISLETVSLSTISSTPVNAEGPIFVFLLSSLLLKKRERETPMASSSSSGSVPNAPRKYDAFISFRGEDTRYNFTSHLHAALNRAFLEVFRDDKKLEKGGEIAPSLIQAIKDSSVSVIVFSEDYASSKWCLDELHQIMQHRKDEYHYVIPIFYKVAPRDVRIQTGAYEKAFEKHEIDYQHYPERVKRWRAALSEAGNLSGFHYQTSTDECDLIKAIVAYIGKQLELVHNGQGTLKDAIGIDEMIKPIEELFEKSHEVGFGGWVVRVRPQ